MTGPAREAILAKTFVSLADTLVAGYDMVELLQILVDRSVEVVDAVSAGILLAADDGHLEVVASTDESSHLIELMQQRAGEGPCVEAYLTGQVVAIGRLWNVPTWPEFSVRAQALGYASVHAVPMRLRDDTIGTLNLFRDREGFLTPDDAEAARALADVATIGILQERAFREADLARAQLQRALDSRVVVEQAKGHVAHTHGVGMDDAFRLIRDAGRARGIPLDEVARGVLDRSIEV